MMLFRLFVWSQIQLTHHCRYCRAFSKSADSFIKAKKTGKQDDIKKQSLTNVEEISSKLKQSQETILDLLKEYGYSVKKEGGKIVLDKEIVDLLHNEFGDKSKLRKRPPVVTIMGHVDHGKTTLLDYLRKTQVAEGEAGGITQAISAFSVKVPGVQDSITFVDTPGHAAFDKMRARGSQITDVVVLIVAADDGVMKQTKECIEHIKRAKVPVIVALSKIDKSTEHLEKIKGDLMEYGIVLEEYGGNVKSVAISALKGTNIDELLVILNNLSVNTPFYASHDTPAKAVVIETETTRHTGTKATLLLKEGTLTKGKVLLIDGGYAKVKQMHDSNGKIIQVAYPSDPVQVQGWKTLPKPGDVTTEVSSEREARKILKEREQEKKTPKVKEPLQTSRTMGKQLLREEFKRGLNKRLPYRVALRADAVRQNIYKNDGPQNLNIVLKADVSGSLEAIVNIISRYHNPDIRINIVKADVGGVIENDIKSVESVSDGIVYSFNSALDKRMMKLAEKSNVDIRQFKVIYELLDDLKETMEARLPSITDEFIIGEAEVLQVFQFTRRLRGLIVAGCRILDGSMDITDKSYVAKVVRDNKTIHQGPFKSLKRKQEDVTTVQTPLECGIVLKNFTEYEQGDTIFCVRLEQRKQYVEWDL